MATAIKRLKKEFELQKTSLAQTGVELKPVGEDKPLEWVLRVQAPATYVLPGQGETESPYKGKVFEVSVKCNDLYPHKAPVEVSFTPGTFFHPLVNTESGEACRNLYEPSWGATSNLLNLGAKIREAMAQPTAENGINEFAMAAIGKPADYFAKAKAACATLPSA